MTEHPPPVAPDTPHGQYRASTTVWRQDSRVTLTSSTLIVQCACQGPHTSDPGVEVKYTARDGYTAWIVIGTGPQPEPASELAKAVAKALGPTLE